MKNLLLICLFIPLLFATSCKKTKNESVEIVRDCTGTYLRDGSKDYRVCNTSMTDAFEDSDRVVASFKKIDSCPEQDGLIFCELYHEYKSWIEVSEIEIE